MIDVRSLCRGGRSWPAETTVLDAAALLDVAEIELFRQAWRRWYGEEGGLVVERRFLRYMFRGEIPFWVRDYCRHVLADARAGCLDRARFGIRPDHAAVNPRRGLLLALLVVAAFVALMLLAGSDAPHIPGIEGCLLPPCY